VTMDPEGRGGIAAAQPPEPIPCPESTCPPGSSGGSLRSLGARPDSGVSWLGTSHPCVAGRSPGSATLPSRACWAKRGEGSASWRSVTVPWMHRHFVTSPACPGAPAIPRAAPGLPLPTAPAVPGSALRAAAGACPWHR